MRKWKTVFLSHSAALEGADEAGFYGVLPKHRSRGVVGEVVFEFCGRHGGI